eukprot:Skav220190  [mRNA]  locus=scaffold1074:190707:199507:+ [translate_table: standard]
MFLNLLHVFLFQFGFLSLRSSLQVRCLHLCCPLQLLLKLRAHDGLPIHGHGSVHAHLPERHKHALHVVLGAHLGIHEGHSLETAVHRRQFRVVHLPVLPPHHRQEADPSQACSHSH